MAFGEEVFEFGLERRWLWFVHEGVAVVTGKRDLSEVRAESQEFVELSRER